MTAVVLLGVLIVTLRLGFSGRVWVHAAKICMAASIILGLIVGRIIMKRLLFHEFNGLFLKDTQNSLMRRYYIMAWHFFGVTALIATTLVSRPSLLVACLPGYLLGALIIHQANGIIISESMVNKHRNKRFLRTKLITPYAVGIFLFLLLFVLFLTNFFLPHDELNVVSCFLSLLFSLLLTGVDRDVVRFQIISGYKPWRIFIRQAKYALIFVLISSIIGCLFNYIVSYDLFISSFPVIIFMTLRVFLYSVYEKKVADILVSAFFLRYCIFFVFCVLYISICHYFYFLVFASSCDGTEVDAYMKTIIQLNNVSIERNAVRIVHNITSEIPERSWFGLIGANGSGKTTLLRAIAGRLPFVEGSCRIDGNEMIADRMARADRIGFCPPADTLPGALRAGELLKLVGENLDGLWSRLSPLRVALGLDALLDRWIADCSAGMRQRIAIATAFIGGQTLVILDEPFNWLDPVAIFDLRHALRTMVDDGLTLITALHDLNTLATNCDMGLVISNGRVAMTLDEKDLSVARENFETFEQNTISMLRI
nr:ABC transporter ATP-binding protein [Gluconacetobacter sacchari]